MKQHVKQQVVTANQLADGRVVYLTAPGDWSNDIGDSAVAADPDAAARLMELADAAAAQQIVVEPYLIPVVAEDGGIRPARYREVIRASGPSVRPDLGRHVNAVNSGAAHVSL